MSYVIYTDSSANLTNEIIEQYGIKVIPLVFLSGGKEYLGFDKDNPVDLLPFYKMLRKKELITTSCVNDNDFVNAFGQDIKEGKDIIYLSISSNLSATYSNALKAVSLLKNGYPQRKIIAVDSLGASMGQGLMAMYAAKMQKEGKTIDETADWLENNKLKLCHYFTVDNLFYLFRGGRVKATSYLLANIINIKPIMHADDNGKLVAIGKVVGRNKSISVLAQKTIENIVNPNEQIICIAHGDCIDDAMSLRDKILSQIQVKDCIINYLDPVIGAHSGPDTLAVFFLGTKR